MCVAYTEFIDSKEVGISCTRQHVILHSLATTMMLLHACLEPEHLHILVLCTLVGRRNHHLFEPDHSLGDCASNSPVAAWLALLALPSDTAARLPARSLISSLLMPSHYVTIIIQYTSVRQLCSHGCVFWLH